MFPVRKFDINQHVKIPHLKEDKSNISDFFAVDVQGNKAIPLNYGGWIRNDLAVINAQHDMRVAKSMALELYQAPEIPVNVNKSDAEIMLHAKSKYCQSPSEMTKYIERELEFRDAEIIRRNQIAIEAQKLANKRQELKNIEDSLTPEEREEVRTARRKKVTNKLV